MIWIRHSGVTAVPAPLAFEYVSDHWYVPDWMFGLSRFDPVGDVERGLGAKYAASLKLGPKVFEATVRTTEWTENELFVLETVDGFAHSSRWHFEAVSPDETRLNVEFGYGLPGGLAGKALGKLVEPMVGEAVRRTESELRTKLEARYYAD
ncbi:SRPBCC family protein [Rhodococcus rhodnii]|uniref:Coenzyme Q-binding protein COQ10 START domain-containing protein n=2 Tax=Rhodococcus rhodnii TaxID=38312 RepID=R7WIS7_9NOCA|nr:SRPBCC family protein [Rhodococcus rhodnii]EOM75147.1 hypothetical protein Rrhod_3557 [Rhodococcus rhodnii LMG 5362]TXG92340.1 SRPBCC family protein [Rhodococcus rhodnii]